MTGSCIWEWSTLNGVTSPPMSMKIFYEYLYKPYEKMGGNGSAKRIMNEVNRLPIHKSQYEEEQNHEHE